MTPVWNYKCESCGRPFQVERRRVERSRKATCSCGGQGSFVRPYLPRMKVTDAPMTPAGYRRGEGPVGIIVERGRNVTFSNFKIQDAETAMIVTDSTITVRGGSWNVPIALEKDDKSIVDVSDVTQDVPWEE